MTVVVAYAPTPEGESALREGVREALRRQEDLFVLNAPAGTALAEPTYASPQQLEQVRERLAGEAVRARVVQRMGRGDVAGVVVEALHELSASVVVVGHRRRTPVGKLIMGSVAQRIILDAPCPVVTVKPPAAG
ncbi:universal stress protein [Kineococcus indalonis]|uniref:universal stress protein n=1 Tax=Kineococcus indalonis TaxID=2696566 RepID=UPI001412A364|nr:universal stress protein [Kineococcus indalonis]NAZ85375.1 universal stress protein [Kineococcus indalonis]